MVVMELRDQDAAAAALAVEALLAGVLADESLDDPAQDLMHPVVGVAVRSGRGVDIGWVRLMYIAWQIRQSHLLIAIRLSPRD